MKDVLVLAIVSSLQVYEVNLHSGQGLLGQDGLDHQALPHLASFVGAGFTPSQEGHYAFLGDICKLFMHLLLHDVSSSMTLLNMQLMKFIKELLIAQEPLHGAWLVQP